MKTGQTKAYYPNKDANPAEREVFVEVFPEGTNAKEILFLHDLPKKDKKTVYDSSVNKLAVQPILVRKSVVDQWHEFHPEQRQTVKPKQEIVVC